MRRMAIFIRVLVTITCVFLVQGCERAPVVHSLSGTTMGTTYSVKYTGSVHVQQAEIDKKLDEINASMSTYLPDSQISRFNQASTQAHNVSVDFARVFEQSKWLYEKSQGAFDPTIMPLVDMWGFGPSIDDQKIPAQEKILKAKALIGLSSVTLQKQGLRYGVQSKHVRQLDFSAIAKGYGVDAVAQLLDESGIQNYLVEIGGEVKAKGNKAADQPWKIAIEKPVAGERSIARVIAMKGVAIATSGDYRNYFEQNGVRYSHTLDPRTGYPITHKLVSVSVLHEEAAMADGLATALMVMGPEEGVNWATQYNIDALFIVKQDDGFKERTTGKFAKYVVQ